MAIQNFEGHGAPGVTIVGEVGDIYTDLDTGKVYQCSMVYRYAASQSLDGVTHEYVWKEKDEKLAYSEMAEVTKTFDVTHMSYNMYKIEGLSLVAGTIYSTTMDGTYYEAEAVAETRDNGYAILINFLMDDVGDNEFIIMFIIYDNRMWK